MSDKSVTIRVPRRVLRLGAVVVAVGVITASSVALASHTFNDVDSNNTFHEAITWLKEAGVTIGCNPPSNTEYCPEDNVTREQMAAFMKRLAENRVVDAAQLQGQPASDFTQDLMWVETSNTFTEWLVGSEEQATVTCPGGALVVSGGSREEGTNIVLVDSYPDAARQGWVAVYRNSADTEQTAEVVVFALCAKYSDKSPSAFQQAGVDPDQG